MVENKDNSFSPFTTAVYDFLHRHVDNIDVETISGSDFSTLLDLKKAIDAVVGQGMERWRSGSMS